MPLLENFEKQGNILFRNRGILPIIIIVPGLIITYYSKTELFYIFKTLWYKFYELICILICFIGFFIRVITIGFTPKNTSGRNTDKQIAEELNTTGMYSIVRHPLYLGNYIMWLGICLRTFNLPFIIIMSLFFWIYYERIMFSEEQFLRQKFGDEYLSWSSSTPTFIPNFGLWRQPNINFNVKKVLRQEKNGFVVIFLMFFIFQLITEWELGRVFTNEWYWMFGLIFSTIIYLILRYLKYNTSFLSD